MCHANDYPPIGPPTKTRANHAIMGGQLGGSPQSPPKTSAFENPDLEAQIWGDAIKGGACVFENYNLQPILLSLGITLRWWEACSYQWDRVSCPQRFNAQDFGRVCRSNPLFLSLVWFIWDYDKRTWVEILD